METGEFTFNDTYLIDRDYGYVCKRVNNMIYDLDENDIVLLKENNEGAMRVIDDSDDNTFADMEYREFE